MPLAIGPGSAIVVIWFVTFLHLSACQSDRSDSYPHEAEEIGSVYDVYNASLMPDLQVNTFRNTHRLFATRTVKRGPDVYDLPYTDDVIVGMNIDVDDEEFDFFDYVSLNRVAGLLVIKEGEIVHESYHLGNTEETRWMSMSVVKSITATLAGAALQDGYIDSLDDTVGQYIPVLRGSAYEGVTVRQLLQMTSGVGWVEPYADPDSNRKVLLEAQIAQLPGGMIEVMKALPKVAEPGQVWNYSTGETQVLGELLVSATGMTLSDFLSEKIWSSFGMESDAEWWLDSPNGVEIGGSGLSATLRDYGRFGQFLLNEGMVKGEKVLPAGWIEESTREQIIGNDPIPYGYMVWPVPTQAGEAHRTAFEAKGLYGQLIYVNPKESLVIVVLRAWPKSWLMEPIISDYQFFDSVIETLR